MLICRFSGSDVFTLTQDAIYEPLRKCQYAKYFKKIENKYYVPCQEYEQGAFKMNLNEIPEPEYLLPPDVCVEDYLIALKKIKRTVSDDDLKKQEEFTAEFGQEG